MQIVRTIVRNTWTVWHWVNSTKLLEVLNQKKRISKRMLVIRLRLRLQEIMTMTRAKLWTWWIATRTQRAKKITAPRILVKGVSFGVDTRS